MSSWCPWRPFLPDAGSWPRPSGKLLAGVVESQLLHHRELAMSTPLANSPQSAVDHTPYPGQRPKPPGLPVYQVLAKPPVMVKSSLISSDTMTTEAYRPADAVDSLLDPLIDPLTDPLIDPWQRRELPRLSGMLRSWAPLRPNLRNAGSWPMFSGTLLG